MWRPSPGAVYPALQQLEDEGLVRAEEAVNSGQPSQIAEAKKALSQTRRTLYTILSKDVDDEE
jgi:predicted transcriptional regulator